MIKAVILIGGPSRGKRFRPLSLYSPVKPLFPIAGQTIIGHHLLALSKLGCIDEVLIIGFYNECDLDAYIRYAEVEFNLKIR